MTFRPSYYEWYGYFFSDFTEGQIKFDDLDVNGTQSNQNALDGHYPEGVFDGNTLFYYCCRWDKPAEVPVKFPSSEPFQLLVGPLEDACQEVEG